MTQFDKATADNLAVLLEKARTLLEQGRKYGLTIRATPDFFDSMRQSDHPAVPQILANIGKTKKTFRERERAYTAVPGLLKLDKEPQHSQLRAIQRFQAFVERYPTLIGGLAFALIGGLVIAGLFGVGHLVSHYTSVHSTASSGLKGVLLLGALAVAVFTVGSIGTAFALIIIGLLGQELLLFVGWLLGVFQKAGWWVSQHLSTKIPECQSYEGVSTATPKQPAFSLCAPFNGMEQPWPKYDVEQFSEARNKHEETPELGKD